MYTMNADEARKQMIEVETEILGLLRQFEQGSGLTVQGVQLDHHTTLTDRGQQHVRKVQLEVVLR